MAAYWEQNRCTVCSEPLDTEEEKDRGVHEACDPIDRVSGVRVDFPARDQAYYSRTTPNQQLQDACDKAAEILAQIFREARERAMWLSRPDGQGGG